ncbi:MAG: lipocalin-like domain-containing protein [Ramlibacter sp.]|nr:lipocalin-like domain-containing protein [Ramlibacter sp.]
MSSNDDRAASLRDKLLGSWRMISWTRKLSATGEESDALGPHPIGYISYAHDGRVMVLVLKRDRPRPASGIPSEKEKIGLYDTMFAYCGTYDVEEGQVIHTIDASWNENWTGTRQIRLLSFEAGRLVYTTHDTTDPMDGKQCTYRVMFERT